MTAGLPFTDAELERFQETLRQGGTVTRSSNSYNPAAGQSKQPKPFADCPACHTRYLLSSGHACKNGLVPPDGSCAQCANVNLNGLHTCVKKNYLYGANVPTLQEEWAKIAEQFEAGWAEPKPLEVEVSLCTAKPNCGFPDEECPVCRAKNCPGAKCWRGCEVKR